MRQSQRQLQSLIPTFAFCGGAILVLVSAVPIDELIFPGRSGELRAIKRAANRTAAGE
jgi:hypothetical protein